MGRRSGLFHSHSPKVVKQFGPANALASPRLALPLTHQPPGDPSTKPATMPRKGTATIKTPNKDDKYIVIGSDSDETTSDGVKSGLKSDSNSSSPDIKINLPERRERGGVAGQVLETASGHVKAGEPLRRPWQETTRTTVTSFFELALHTPPKPPAPAQSILYHRHHQAPRPLEKSSPTARLHAPAPNRTAARPAVANQAHETEPKAAIPTARVKKPPKAHTSPVPDNASAQDMASSGSYIPPSQQRNMRACMVCSIVRTSQQFLQQGCPNCEYILELIGNPDQINDCTSQVFEGLITVADTQRSWVARYQRLEGYVPGVYATQVEGILPEDVIGAVESAGINYVPRDGSEQEMLPKD
ncbi:hypothetical protein NX059_001624 [Plenodomus lindquistii]|nr:hypothetical protein NX059_001624 [Plenodomus lindquistii]